MLNITFEMDALKCPSCGGEYLHHQKVTTYARHEDAEHVLMTTAHKYTATTEHVENDTSGNPSSRRDGIVVTFECEHCGVPSALAIAQHKGSTLVYWVK
jgi:hypothetical protein